MKVTIAVATHNRQGHLPLVIRDLLGQNYKSYEIFIADQSEINFDHNILNRKKVHYYHLDYSSLTSARNFLINKAQGQIIIFIDDDVRIKNKSFIKNHVDNYKDESIVGVAGRIVDRRDYPIEEDPQRILKITRFGKILGGKNGVVRTEIDTLSGGNMSFRLKPVHEEEIVFDEKLIGTELGEEVNFSRELVKKTSGKIIFDPKAELYHLALDSGGCGNRSISPKERTIKRQYNLARIAFLNTDLVNPVLFLGARLIALVKHSLLYFDPTILFKGVYQIVIAIRRIDSRGGDKCFS